MLCENVLWSAHAFCVEPKLNGARLLCYVWHGVEYQQWCAPNAGFGETKFHYTLSHVVSPVPAYGMHTCDCVWALYKQKQNQTYRKKTAEKDGASTRWFYFLLVALKSLVRCNANTALPWTHVAEICEDMQEMNLAMSLFYAFVLLLFASAVYPCVCVWFCCCCFIFRWSSVFFRLWCVRSSSSNRALLGFTHKLFSRRWLLGDS